MAIICNCFCLIFCDFIITSIKSKFMYDYLQLNLFLVESQSEVVSLPKEKVRWIDHFQMFSSQLKNVFMTLDFFLSQPSLVKFGLQRPDSQASDCDFLKIDPNAERIGTSLSGRLVYRPNPLPYPDALPQTKVVSDDVCNKIENSWTCCDVILFWMSWSRVTSLNILVFLTYSRMRKIHWIMRE